MKKVAILTSGGDSPGMNAAIRSVVRTGIYSGFEMYGIESGYQGLIEGKLFKMGISSVADIIQRGGTMLATSRSDEFETPEGLRKACNVLEVYGIESVVILGGDGSFRGALELQKKGISIMGIPCTIDNDLGYTDYTVGFFTAVTTVTEAINKIRDTSSSHGRANVVEVMGRKCGDIALYSGVAGGAETIIIPEKPFSIDTVARKAMEGKKRGKRHHIIVLSEGVGSAYKLAEQLEELTGIDTKVTILGYLQRGGSPNISDRIIATTMGFEAIQALVRGESGLVFGMQGKTVFSLDLVEALNVEKTFSEELYEVLNVVSI